MKTFRILSYVVAGFWFLSLVFLAFTYRTIDGGVGRWLMEMATISVFGIAILKTLERQRAS